LKVNHSLIFSRFFKLNNTLSFISQNQENIHLLVDSHAALTQVGTLLKKGAKQLEHLEEHTNGYHKLLQVHFISFHLFFSIIETFIQSN
jgi:hypothetical protein